MALAMKITQIKFLVCSFFNRFSIDTLIVLFVVILLSKLGTALSKSAFVTEFSRANLTLKTSATKLLNSGVVIYLS